MTSDTYDMNRNRSMTDQITNGVAGAAILSPLWLEPLNAVSNIAAAMTPILGCIWLGVQITQKIRENRNTINKQEKEIESIERSNLDFEREAIHRAEGDSRPKAQSDHR